MAAAGLQRKPPGGARGLTLIETLVATLILGLIATAIGSSAKVILGTDAESAHRRRVTELGVSLLEEIAALPFNDPQDGGTGLGPNADEWLPPTNRSLFDDVDDYTVWNGSRPLQTKDGTAISLPGFTRAVTVVYISSFGATALSVAPTRYKQIAVRVFEGGQQVGVFTTVRSEGGRHVDFDG